MAVLGKIGSLSRSRRGLERVVVKLMPPFSLRRKVMPGGCLFRRMPKPSSSCSISFLCEMGFRQSSTTRIRLHVRAVLMTCTGVHVDIASLAQNTRTGHPPSINLPKLVSASQPTL